MSADMELYRRLHEALGKLGVAPAVLATVDTVFFGPSEPEAAPPPSYTVACEHVDVEHDEGMPPAGRALMRMSTEGPRIWFRCPRDRLYCGVPVVPSPPNSKGCVWNWNADAANPTLTPSINCNGGGCGWHGFINNGNVT